MPNLDFINTLNPSSIGSAIEVTVASIASPTELNGRAAAQGDLVLARTTEAGTGSQTLYYADTTSDAESLPYIVSSATAGVKFIACGGRYNNGSKAIGGLTASRLLRTDASKNLESNAALTNTYVLYADSNGWPTGSSGFITTGSAAAIGAGTPSPTSVFLVYANDANVSNTQGLTIRQASTGDAVLQLSNPSFRFAWGLDSSTGLMKMCNASGLSDLLGDDTRTLLQFDQSTSILTLCSSTLGSLNVRQAATFSVSSGAGITVSSTTDSTSKDTGSIVTEGGIGVEKSLYAGNSILSVGATNGIGYATGAGGTVTQITSRTTGVTLNKVCGEITLVSAAGSATWQSFTVTNSAMAATDNVVVNQKSGTDLYMIHVTAKAAGSFRISFATTGGTTSEQPVFGFSIIKSVAA